MYVGWHHYDDDVNTLSLRCMLNDEGRLIHSRLKLKVLGYIHSLSQWHTYSSIFTFTVMQTVVYLYEVPCWWYSMTIMPAMLYTLMMWWCMLYLYSDECLELWRKKWMEKLFQSLWVKRGLQELALIHRGLKSILTEVWNHIDRG